MATLPLLEHTPKPRDLALRLREASLKRLDLPLLLRDERVARVVDPHISPLHRREARSTFHLTKLVPKIGAQGSFARIASAARTGASAPQEMGSHCPISRAIET